MIRKENLLLVLYLISRCLSADEDYNELSRDPYQYQFKVDDPKTATRYEISESGSPDIVSGSYRIALPDGRTQIVTYEVHPDKGFDAKVTYEGTAQYPDTPGFVPSAYGPPEPIRPGYAKFKRQSQPKPEKKKIGRKVQEQRKTKTIAVKKEILPSTDLLTASSEKHHFQNQKIQASQKKIEFESFDDTEDSPQAEPLSLQQNSKPSHKKRRQEYKPPTNQKEIDDEEIKAAVLTKLEKPTITPIPSSDIAISPSLVVHEAVPSSSKIPEVYQINYVSGYNGQSFASPRDAFDELADAVFSESVQNPEVIHLETTESKKEVVDPQPITSYPKATTDHGNFKAFQPVASRNEFLNNQDVVEIFIKQNKDRNNDIPAPLEAFVEASNTISDNNVSIRKVISSNDNQQSVVEKEKENEILNRKELLYNEHMKKVKNFISQNFESPSASIVDQSDDTVKNHKKRKIDVNDYYNVKESIGHKPIRKIDFLPVQSANILPTIYRSQIKFFPENNSDEKEEQSDIQENKNNKSGEINVDNISLGVAIIRNKKDHSDKTLFQTKPSYDHTEKPDSVREETTNNSENRSHQEHNSSSLNKFKNLDTDKKIEIIANQEEELYQTIFDEYPPVTTRRPKYKIIRKARIPKQLSPQATVYYPVHRSGNIKLVYKDAGFVPEYVPRY